VKAVFSTDLLLSFLPHINQNTAIWNTLHDGEITTVKRDSADTLTVVVSILYLRERFEPAGDSFIIRLHGFRHLEFSDFDRTQSTSEPSNIANAGIEILSTDSEELPVKIATTLGILTLDFDSLDIHLDTGQQITYSALHQACSDYWEEWSAKS
jgi:hypothetical protein